MKPRVAFPLLRSAALLVSGALGCAPSARTVDPSDASPQLAPPQPTPPHPTPPEPTTTGLPELALTLDSLGPPQRPVYANTKGSHFYQDPSPAPPPPALRVRLDAPPGTPPGAIHITAQPAGAAEPSHEVRAHLASFPTVLVLTPGPGAALTGPVRLQLALHPGALTAQIELPYDQLVETTLQAAPTP